MKKLFLIIVLLAFAFTLQTKATPVKTENVKPHKIQDWQDDTISAAIDIKTVSVINNYGDRLKHIIVNPLATYYLVLWKYDVTPNKPGKASIIQFNSWKIKRIELKLKGHSKVKTNPDS